MTNASPVSNFVADTMGLVLRIEQRKMSQAAKSIFEAAESGQATIFIPSLVFAEILYLSEKKRIALSLNEIVNYLRQYPHFKEYPLDLAVVQAAEKITDIPELHDRLIAGTAHALDLKLITNDPIIQASTFLKTIW
jgi:predicted nucleic acid-binding protein